MGSSPGKNCLAADSADESNMCALEALIGSEDAAAQKRKLNGGEVSRIGTAHHEVIAFAFGHRWMFDDGHEVIAAPAFAGRGADEACGLHAGEGAHALDEVSRRRRPAATGVLVAHIGQADVHGEHVVDGYADVG